MAYGPVDRAESLRALHVALERGVNFFDTSDFYGHGRSEKLIGEALAGRRAQALVATKGGLKADGKSTDFSAAYLRGALEASLRRLGTDYVDVYYLHSPALEQIGEDTMAALRVFQDAGKVRALGLSARSPQEAKEGITRFGFRCVQANFNLLDQRAVECGLLEAARAAGAGVVARTPLSFGFLTGRYAADTDFHANDHRRNWSEAQRRLWAEAPALFAALVAERPGQTPAQFALRFCLSHQAISSTIPGMLTAAHVEENARAGDLPPLSVEELARVAEICGRASFFAGKR